jgi:outer membrane lipase/esterase
MVAEKMLRDPATEGNVRWTGSASREPNRWMVDGPVAKQGWPGKLGSGAGQGRARVRRWIGRAVVVAGLLLAAPAGAAPITDYTSFHVLGDSLSDRGNIYRATFGAIPQSPPYWHGRFSNGPVWAEHVAAVFATHGLPTGNHAWGNARAAGSFSPDLAWQARRYRLLDEDRRGDRPLVALWAGANDIMGSVGANVWISGHRAARAVGATAGSLVSSGVDDFLIFNMPDLGLLPLYNGRDDLALSASRGTRAYNRELGRQIAGLRAEGANVVGVNAFWLMNAVVAHPRRFGVRDTETPCLNDGVHCGPYQARIRAFFDDKHPNRILHAGLGDRALAATAAAPAPAEVAVAAAAPAPVPLPAPALLLGGALLWLGVLRHFNPSCRKKPNAS